MFRSLILLFGLYLVVFTPTEANDNYLLSKDECLNAAKFAAITDLHRTCCLGIDIVDEAATTCKYTVEKYPKVKYTNDENLNYILSSMVIECIYEKRHFIKSNDEVNLTAVAVYAKQYYESDQQDFIVKVYTSCEKTAIDNLTTWQGDPESKMLLDGTHKPFFMFVYICVASYMVTDCPYFIWKGVGPNEKLCEDYARQCRERYFE